MDGGWWTVVGGRWLVERPSTIHRPQSTLFPPKALQFLEGHGNIGVDACSRPRQNRPEQLEHGVEQTGVNMVLIGVVGLAGEPYLAQGLLRVRPVEVQPAERRARLKPRFAEGFFAPSGIAGFSGKPCRG